MRRRTLPLDVELITPAMIGGHDPRACDHPPTLRGPSLRGVLRFWSRALAGSALAEELFGTVDTGPRVRVRSFDPLPAPKDYLLLPHKKSPKEQSMLPMIPPGGRARIWFDVPEGVSVDQLRAVVWTWLHLGGIGRRSRRGYGSLCWLPQAGDLLSGFAAPAGADEVQRFEASLRDGLKEVARVLGAAWQARRETQDDFRLSSLDQVFVGQEVLEGEWRPVGEPGPGDGTLESMASRIHGFSGESRQTGATGTPSPMFWRLHRAKAGYRVVMTWSPRGFEAEEYPQADQDSGLYKYLHEDLSLGPSLPLDGGKLGRG